MRKPLGAALVLACLAWLAVGAGRAAEPAPKAAQPPVYGDSYFVAGTGADGHRDGGFLEASFSDIAGISLDPDARKLYVAEESGHSVRVVDLDAAGGPQVSTLPGSVEALRRPVAITQTKDGFVVWDAGASKLFQFGKDGAWGGELMALPPGVSPAGVTGVACSLAPGWEPGTWLLWDQSSSSMALVSPAAAAADRLVAAGGAPRCAGSPDFVKLGDSIYWVGQDGPHLISRTGKTLDLGGVAPGSAEGIWWASCAYGDMILAYEFSKGEFQHWHPIAKALGHAKPLDRGTAFLWDTWGKRMFSGRDLLAYQPGLEQTYVAEAGSRRIFAVKNYRLTDDFAPPAWESLYFPPQRQKGLKRMVVVGASQWYYYDNLGNWKVGVRGNLTRRMEEAINLRSALAGRPEHWELGLVARGGTEMTGAPVSLAWAHPKQILASGPDVVVVGISLVDIQREALSFMLAQPDAQGFGAAEQDPEWITAPVKRWQLDGFAKSLRDLIVRNPKRFEPWIKIKSDGRMVVQTYDANQFELIPDPEFRAMALDHFVDLAVKLDAMAKEQWKTPLVFAFLPSRNVMSMGELDDANLPTESPELSQQLLARMHEHGLAVLDSWTPAYRADAAVFPLFLGNNRHFNLPGCALIGDWLAGQFLDLEGGLPTYAAAAPVDASAPNAKARP